MFLAGFDRPQQGSEHYQWCALNQETPCSPSGNAVVLPCRSGQILVLYAWCWATGAALRDKAQTTSFFH